MSDRALSVLVHGDSKVGKSTFALTAPTPILLFDVEAASRFIKRKKITWNPLTDAPPVYDGTWEVCVVLVRDFTVIAKAYEWLKAGKHHFKSIVLDSISEAQVKLQEDLVGRKQLQTQDWGRMLQILGGFARDLRDLTLHPTNAPDAVVIVATSREKDGFKSPFLQGQIASTLPYLTDITGFLYVEPEFDEAKGEWIPKRKLITSKHDKVEAGQRVGEDFPYTVENPNIAEMLDLIFGPAAPAAKPVAQK